VLVQFFRGQPKRAPNTPSRRLPRPPVASQRKPPPPPSDKKPAATGGGARVAALVTSAAVPCAPVKPGELKFSDDTASKHGSFWLELPFEWSGDAGSLGNAAAHVLDLYPALEQQAQPGLALRVRLRGNGLALERGGTAAEAGATERLAEAALAQPLSGSNVLGVLWLSGELSVWLGPR